MDFDINAIKNSTILTDAEKKKAGFLLRSIKIQNSRNKRVDNKQPEVLTFNSEEELKKYLAKKVQEQEIEEHCNSRGKEERLKKVISDNLDLTKYTKEEFLKLCSDVYDKQIENTEEKKKDLNSVIKKLEEELKKKKKELKDLM